MRDTSNDTGQEKRPLGKKILLGLLPYWTPLIPPMAISYLKAFVQPHGFEVTTFDANVELEFKELYNRYFDTMKRYIPPNKRGNYYNIGHDLLQNHMMAHIHYQKEDEYFDLVQRIVHETYYCNLNNEQIAALNQVLDEFYTTLRNYFVALLEEEKPDVLGLSVYIHTLPASLFAFKLTREKYPHIKTVMGGAMFIWQFPVGTSEFEFLLEKTEDYLDKIIVAEGQNLFLKYLRGELDESKRVYTLEDIDGQRLNISAVGIPDFADLKLDFYPYIATSGSKSCPNQCSFCTISRYFGKYQEKGARQTAEEIMALHEKNGRRQLFFLIDSLVNHILPDLTAELARSDTAIYFDGYLRVDNSVCDIENTLAWRQGGFYRARIGTESGSQRILDLIDKRITLDQTRAALASLAYAGIKTTTFWIVGHPGESEEEFQMTLDFVEELKDYIYEAEFNPFFYFYAGQSREDEWVRQSKLLYPEWARDMLISQTYILDVYPSREVTYGRLNRFIEHCIRLGIPNPYSMSEIHYADERWKKLHKNAAPALVDLEDPTIYVDDRKHVARLVSVRNINVNEATFGF
jgi:radical SAM superfamily enzyme YgiQ (UPF0313 family)